MKVYKKYILNKDNMCQTILSFPKNFEKLFKNFWKYKTVYSLDKDT